jgi:hypothetical protein
MKRIRKALVLVASAYMILWVATYFLGPLLLKRDMYRQSVRDISDGRKCLEKEGRTDADTLERYAWSRAPIVTVELLSCPAPFLIKANREQTIGTHNGIGLNGKYIVTPWRIYVIDEDIIWLP